MIEDMDKPQADSFHDELTAHLEAFGVDSAPDAYRVEQVLKTSPYETTELVYVRTLDGGELGPYVRKKIRKAEGLGNTYQLLFNAQASGTKLRHVPRIFRCEEKGEHLEVLMEYVQGPTVREMTEARGADGSLTLAAELMPALCDAVSELHVALGVPVIHRDLTPGNAICPNGNPQAPVLIDFAIARAWRADAETDTSHFGTRSYAPPEQFGFGQTDVRTDVYALGMLAFFCLTGRDPYPEDRRIGFHDEAVPEAWRAVIEKACALDPSERYASARQLRRAFEEAAQAACASRSAASAQAASAEQARATGVAEIPMPNVPAREARLFSPRNVIVMAACLLLIAASAWDAFDPTQRIKASAAANLFGFLVVIPALFLLLGYLALDKRWLRANALFLQGKTPKQEWLILLGVFVATMVVWFLMIGFLG